MIWKLYLFPVDRPRSYRDLLLHRSLTLEASEQVFGAVAGELDNGFQIISVAVEVEVDRFF